MKWISPVVAILFLWSATLSSCEEAADNSSEKITGEMLVDSIASNYGFHQFHRIDSLKFTFAVTSPRGESARHWTWMPKAKKVRFTGNDTSISFHRPITKSDTFLQQYDAWFINDKYWLLFPFQIKWDSTTIIYKETDKAPISNEKSGSLKFIYPEESGYTPGDSYTVYFDSTYTIREWTYCPENNCERGMSFSWKDQESIGPLLLTTRFEREKGDFAIEMKDVKVYFE